MAFKNAFKNLVAHFGIVWALLLYIIVCVAIIVGLSLPFVLPVLREFGEVGVFTSISDAFGSLFNDGGWNGLWDGLYNAYEAVRQVYANGRIVSLTMTFLILVPIIVIRFLLGLIDIPLATVLDGRLSCNANYGLGGKFFSTLSVSVRYSLAKMPVTILLDGVFFGAIYGLGVAIGMNFILPFVLILTYLLLRPFRSAMLACWAPSVVNGSGVIKGFVRSLQICFKRFGSMYSTYFVSHMLLLAVGIFVTVFTLGVGLMIALPFAGAYLGYLDMTEFYNKTGRRYYIDNVVFTPPVDNTL